MATFLSKLFKRKKETQINAPKSTKAKEPAVNIEALDPKNSEDLATLVKVMKNLTTEEQKKSALQRISSLDQIIGFIQGTSPESSPELLSKIKDLLDQSSNKKDALKLLSLDQRLSLAPWLSDEGLLDELISDISNESELATIATTGKSSKIRQLAVKKIDQEELLKQIQKQAKGKDKKVFQITKEKLSLIKEEQTKQTQLDEKLTSLIKQIEAHANTEPNKLYEAKLKTLKAQWGNLLESATQQQVEQVAALVTSASEKARQFQEKQRQADLEKAEIAEQGNQRQATLDVLEQTIASIKSNTSHNGTEAPALDAVIKTQETRWMEATKNTEVSKSEQKQYQQMMHELKRWHTATIKCNTLPEEIAEIVNTHTGDENAKLSGKAVGSLKRFLEDINWPDEYAAPLVLSELESLLGDHFSAKQKLSSDVKKLRSDLENLIGKLEQHLEEKQLKKSQNLHRECNRILKTLPSSAADKYKAKIQLLGAQVDDLKDWQGYAAQPKQIELCEKMELLANANLEPQSKSDQIKSLQNEWRNLGGSSDQDLWQRFKKAADEAFEPCRVFFEEQKQLKQVNLEKRKTICSELESYLNQNNWEQADWKAAEKIGRAARDEWKQAFPIDFKEGKPIQNQFNSLLDKLDDYLNTERTKNESLKKDIVSRAEKLLDQEELQKAINEAKNLQKEWTTIGITRYGEDRKLWKAFRSVCDQIFAKRDQEKKQAENQKNDLLSQAEKICKDAESLPNDTEGRLQVLRKLNKSLIELPIGGKEITPYKERIKTCIDQQNTVNLEREKADFVKAWVSIFDNGNSAGELQASLKLSDAQLKRIATKELADHLPEDAKETCILLEISCGIESPSEDNDIRMKLQVNRLSESLKNQSANESKFQSLTDLLVNWHIIRQKKDDPDPNLDARVNHCLDNLKL